VISIKVDLDAGDCMYAVIAGVMCVATCGERKSLVMVLSLAEVVYVGGLLSVAQAFSDRREV
jgi:hypothetical protein